MEYSIGGFTAKKSPPLAEKKIAHPAGRKTAGLAFVFSGFSEKQGGKEEKMEKIYTMPERTSEGLVSYHPFCGTVEFIWKYGRQVETRLALPKEESLRMFPDRKPGEVIAFKGLAFESLEALFRVYDAPDFHKGEVEIHSFHVKEAVPVDYIPVHGWNLPDFDPHGEVRQEVINDGFPDTVSYVGKARVEKVYPGTCLVSGYLY